MVCGCYFEPDKNSRWLCLRRSMVSCHSNCNQQRWCARICSKNSFWGMNFFFLFKKKHYLIRMLKSPNIVLFFSQALQAPACHENMVKVGGYILGEFGNLIAGDQRSSPLVQFQLLHSKVSTFSFRFAPLFYKLYIITFSCCNFLCFVLFFSIICALLWLELFCSPLMSSLWIYSLKSSTIFRKYSSSIAIWEVQMQNFNRELQNIFNWV